MREACKGAPGSDDTSDNMVLFTGQAGALLGTSTLTGFAFDLETGVRAEFQTICGTLGISLGAGTGWAVGILFGGGLDAFAG